MNTYKTESKKERALLISSQIKKASSLKNTEESLTELENLAVTAGVMPLKKFYQMLNKPVKTYVGSGKLLSLIHI